MPDDGWHLQHTVSRTAPANTMNKHTHITEYEQTQKHPQLCLGGKAKSFWDSSTSFHFYISCDVTILVGVYALWALLYSVYQRHSDCRRFQIRRFECKNKVFEYSCISIEIIYGLLLFLDSLFCFFSHVLCSTIVAPSTHPGQIRLWYSSDHLNISLVQKCPIGRMVS